MGKSPSTLAVAFVSEPTVGVGKEWEEESAHRR